MPSLLCSVLLLLLLLARPEREIEDLSGYSRKLLREPFLLYSPFGLSGIVVGNRRLEDVSWGGGAAALLSIVVVVEVEEEELLLIDTVIEAAAAAADADEGSGILIILDSYTPL